MEDSIRHQREPYEDRARCLKSQSHLPAHTDHRLEVMLAADRHRLFRRFSGYLRLAPLVYSLSPDRWCFRSVVMRGAARLSAEQAHSGLVPDVVLRVSDEPSEYSPGAELPVNRGVEFPNEARLN